MLRRTAVLKRICDRWMAQNATASILVETPQQLLIEIQFFSRSMHNVFLMVDLEDGNKHSALKQLEVNPRL